MRYPFVLVIPVAIVAAVMGNRSDPNPVSPSEIVSVDAPELYEMHCRDCHGVQGRDFIGREWKFGSTAEDINRIIQDGFPLLGMPGYAGVLDEIEITELTEYVLACASEDAAFQQAPTALETASDLTLKAHVIVDGLETPWGMDFVNDSTLLITEREGRLWMLQSGRLTAIEGLPEDIHVKGQGGLLDVMHWFDQTENQGWVYLAYSKDAPDDKNLSATSLVRAPWSDSVTSIEAWQTAFVASPYESTHHHYGSRIQMARDGTVYLTCGERGKRDVHPQTLTTSPGKVHRFNPDGSIPPDNPFLDVDDAVPSIWSWGHRNPQGMIIHPVTGDVWTHEHGPKGGDEINIAKKGLNYGWPRITFGRNYIGTIITRDTAMVGMEQPLYYWLPSIGACGMEMVHGGNWPSTWQGNLLVGSLSFEYLERLQLENNRVVKRERLLDGIGRVRDIARNSKGEIFVAVEGAGIILHLEPINPQ